MEELHAERADRRRPPDVAVRAGLEQLAEPRADRLRIEPQGVGGAGVVGLDGQQGRARTEEARPIPGAGLHPPFELVGVRGDLRSDG